jgi:hypothetical protein
MQKVFNRSGLPPDCTKWKFGTVSHPESGQSHLLIPNETIPNEKIPNVKIPNDIIPNQKIPNKKIPN